jgi:hypothetical protein
MHRPHFAERSKTATPLSALLTAAALRRNRPSKPSQRRRAHADAQLGDLIGASDDAHDLVIG